MTRLWGFRAGKHGERERASIENGRLYPGFQEDRDLSEFSNRDEILEYLEGIRPDEGRSRLRNYASQRNQFVNQFRSGDYVALLLKTSGKILIGRLDGRYCYDGRKDGYGHSWPVLWQEEFSREVFKKDLLFSFGASQTLFGVQRNSALKRVQAVLKTGRDPGPNLGTEGKVKSANNGDSDFEGEEFDSEDDAGFTDIEELVQDQIENRIKSEFAGHDLAELVEAILKADGYFTRASPPGPDGGVDILAARGILGFDDDRICVQVKSGDRAADKNVVLQMEGSIRDHGAQKGLLVSIGGVDNAARNHLKMKFFDMRLWQLPDLLANLYRTYNNLPEEIRARLNLKQIWIPIEDQ